MKPLELLLTEDNAGEILLMKQILAREPIPISLHVAVDGEQAVDILAARQFHPDLIVLDLNLPKKSGFAVLESAKPNVPVIVFTSSSNPQDRQRAIDLGATDYVSKPTDLDEYSRVVSTMVRRWSKAA